MFEGKTVLVTGATSGIGYATTKAFYEAGAKVIACGRNYEKLARLANDLAKQENNKLLTLEFDISDYKSVQSKLNSRPEAFAQVDILVNNAGLALGLEPIQESNVEDWETMIDTNIKGLLYVTRTILPEMVKRNQGHVFNIGSISGHQVYSGGVVYCATKFAVKALSRGIKMDVHGTPIRVSEIDPGMLKSNFSNVRFSDNQQRADSVYEGVQPLVGEDIARAILFCASAPPHVNIAEMLILPVAQTATHMLHRESKP